MLKLPHLLRVLSLAGPAAGPALQASLQASLLASLLAGLLSASASAQSCPNPDFLEPNNTCATASTSLQGAGTAQAMDINLSSGDLDHFIVPLQPGERVTMTMNFSHAVADLDFFLYLATGGSCGAELDRSESVTDVETVTYTNASNAAIDVIGKATWYGTVSGAPCNQYDITLVVDASPCGMDDSFEDNDSCSTANFALPFGKYTDLFVSDVDEDFWSLSLFPGGGIMAWIDFEHDDGDLDLRVFDVTNGCPGVQLASSLSTSDQEIVEVLNQTGALQRIVVQVQYYPNDGGCNTYDLTVGDIEPGSFFYDICDPTSNSTGQPSSIGVSGTPFVSNNDIRLSVGNLPLNSVGFFLNSRGYGEVTPPGAQGDICINSGGIGRFSRPGEILVAAGPPSVDLQIDLTNIPRAGTVASIQPGEIWCFQYWHRDSINGVPTSNLSGGIALRLQ